MDWNGEGAPPCGHEGRIGGIQYQWPHPDSYDGISEWACMECGRRWGRWSGKELNENESEGKYGRESRTNK